MPNEKVLDQVWEMMRARLGYTEEEFAIFRADPRNEKVLARGAEMATKTVVFEVVESTGCNSGHTVGTRFFFTAEGNLITKLAPSKVCAFVLPNMTQTLFAMQELIYAGADPNELCFKRSGCFDVGVGCGGWGHVVIEARVVDREEVAKLHNG
jgi:hypothetical protein